MQASDLLKEATAQLAAAGIDEPPREARILLAAAMHEARVDRAPTPEERAAFDQMIARRVTRRNDAGDPRRAAGRSGAVGVD